MPDSIASDPVSVTSIPAEAPKAPSATGPRTAGAHRSSRKPILRIAAVVLGAVLLLAAAAFGASAAWIRGTFALEPDQAPWWSSAGVVRLDSGTVALDSEVAIIDLAHLDVAVPFVQGLGRSGLSVVTADGSPVFLASAPVALVDPFVMGTAYDVATLQGGSWSVRSVPGVRALGDPGALPWDASASGRAPVIEPPVSDPSSTASGSVFVRLEGQSPTSLRVDAVFTWTDAGRSFGILVLASVLSAIIGGALVATGAGRSGRGRHRRPTLVEGSGG